MKSLNEYINSLAVMVAILSGILLIMWLVFGADLSYSDSRWVTGIYLASTLRIFYLRLPKED